MTIVTDVQFSWDAETHVLTITTTKAELVSHPSGRVQTSEPVVTTDTIDLSDLVLAP